MNLYSARRTFARSYTAISNLHSPRTLLHFLQTSIDCHSPKLTQQSHALILTHGLEQSAFLATKLISAYAIVGSSADSVLVFNSIWPKDVYIWNSLINGYVKNEAYDEAFSFFYEMQRCTVLPDDYTLATLAKVSGEIGNMVVGKLIHGLSIRVGFDLDIVVANSIMSMYTKYGEFGEARKLFDAMPQRNSGSWNVLLAGYASYDGCSYDMGIWDVVKYMQIDGIKPDAFTVSSLLTLCGSDKGRLNHGSELHCYTVKNDLKFNSGSDFHLGCCLIDMYSRSNKVTIGRRVFNQMTSRNIYAWTAMIKGYLDNGDPCEALILFHKMQVEDIIEPNKVSVTTVIPACNSHAGLMQGKQIHGFAIRKVLNNDTSLCNALIDMYSKCGKLDYARLVFEDDSFRKDAISWSTIISGYGLHGKGKEAIFFYNKMVRLGIEPDMITIVSILSACGRSGLVNEGLNIYDMVVNDYGIKPTVEICASVVDMLGRSGQLDRALDFIKTMPVEPGPSIWGALVSASLMHGNSDIQEIAYRFLIQLEPENPSNFISLSNLYAASRKWDVVAEVRKTMKERGLRKTPGCSWIIVDRKTHCFYVSDKVHPCSKLIYEVVDQLVLIMKGAKYSLNLDNFT